MGSFIGVLTHLLPMLRLEMGGASLTHPTVMLRIRRE
jgi:hypothetical protein